MGLYFYDNSVVEMVKNFKFFFCGELEIMDINCIYMDQGRLFVVMMGCGYVWLDMGMYQSLIEVSNFIVIIEECQGLKVFCLEEIVFCKNFINV